MEASILKKAKPKSLEKYMNYIALMLDHVKFVEEWKPKNMLQAIENKLESILCSINIKE